MSITKVVLAGASGSLGTPMLEALLAAKYEVTVFTRADSSSKFPSSVKVASVDYESVDSLTKALQGQEAIISTLGAPGTAAQKNIIDAAVAAGVKRVVPSEFGCDMEVPANKSSPVYGPKVEVAEYLEKAVKGTPTTYTYIYNNAFLDWGLKMGFVIDGKGKSLLVYDSGDLKVTLCPLDFVAKGTVATLSHLKETENRAVRLHATALSQNETIALAQEVVGKEGWKFDHMPIAEQEQQAFAALKENPANFPAWGFPLLKVGIFNPDRKSNFAGNNDNALLGLKELSPEEVKAVFKASL